MDAFEDNCHMALNFYITVIIEWKFEHDYIGVLCRNTIVLVPLNGDCLITIIYIKACIFRSVHLSSFSDSRTIVVFISHRYGMLVGIYMYDMLCTQGLSLSFDRPEPHLTLMKCAHVRESCHISKQQDQHFRLLFILVIWQKLTQCSCGVDCKITQLHTKLNS